MAAVGNQAYDHFKEFVMKAQHNLNATDTIGVGLSSDNDTQFDVTDDTKAAVNFNINGEDNLVSPAVSTTGVFDAADISIGVDGSTTRSIVLYNESATPANALICWFDTGQGLESTGGTTTSGSPIQITWNVSGIFSIG